jgi:hypothetical protein
MGAKLKVLHNSAPKSSGLICALHDIPADLKIGGMVYLSNWICRNCQECIGAKSQLPTASWVGVLFWCKSAASDSKTGDGGLQVVVKILIAKDSVGKMDSASILDGNTRIFFEAQQSLDELIQMFLRKFPSCTYFL